MRYTNFDLWIHSKVGDEYPTRAVAFLGEATGVLAPRSAEARLRDARDRLSERDVDQAWLIDFGRWLYEQLFAGGVKTLFERCIGQLLNEKDHGMRIRLRIEAPDIAVLPWEFLYWPRKECFLGASVLCPLVRYLEILEPIPDLETEKPLRMLVAIPRSPELDAEQEKTNLLGALAGLDKHVEWVLLEGDVTPTRISDALLEGRFHVFHFIGHGDFKDNRALIKLNAEEGGDQYIDDRQFTSLFLNHPTMKLVFLNSCKGAQTSSAQPLNGMAHQLVKKGIPAVVAMQYSIYDDTAVLFGREFYRSLFKGYARGRVEFAMCHARNRLASESPGDRDIGAPVLFMRASEGLLFNIVEDKKLPRLFPSRDERDRIATYLEALKWNIDTLKDKQRETSEQDIEEAETKYSHELVRLKKSLRLRRYSLAAGAGVSLLMFFFSSLQILDFLPPSIRVESYTLWLANVFTHPPPADRVVVVPITERTETAIGRTFDKSWRREHALLIDKLSQAGAKVIAFDLFMEEPTRYDDELVKAVKRAKERGTTVVGGIRNQIEGKPQVAPSLRTAEMKWGLLCIGKKWGSSQMAPLVVFDQDSQRSLNSLALEAKAAFMTQDVAVGRNAETIHLQDPVTRQLREGIDYSESYTVNWEQPGCPVIGKGNIVAGIFLASLQTYGQPPASYEDIVKQSSTEELAYFSGKIVLVGVRKNEELFPVFRGPFKEARYGVELHAAAVNALLDATVVRPLSQTMELIIMSCLGLLGVVARRLKAATPSHGGFQILTLGTGRRLVFVVIILGGYFMISLVLVNEYHRVLNTVYHLGAFSFAYWITGKLERRWSS